MGKPITTLRSFSSFVADLQTNSNLCAWDKLIKRKDFIKVLTFFWRKRYRKRIADEAGENRRLRCVVKICLSPLPTNFRLTPAILHNSGGVVVVIINAKRNQKQQKSAAGDKAICLPLQEFNPKFVSLSLSRIFSVKPFNGEISHPLRGGEHKRNNTENEGDGCSVEFHLEFLFRFAFQTGQYS